MHRSIRCVCMCVFLHTRVPTWCSNHVMSLPSESKGQQLGTAMAHPAQDLSVFSGFATAQPLSLAVRRELRSGGEPGNEASMSLCQVKSDGVI